ncbi:MAG: lytic transglycosylase domain-containing protein [Eubacteriaceae bacterium]|nr:lytic transglycosylase domain-containing protein [Eubacteriaceae bacterium]
MLYEIAYFIMYSDNIANKSNNILQYFLGYAVANEYTCIMGFCCYKQRRRRWLLSLRKQANKNKDTALKEQSASAKKILLAITALLAVMFFSVCAAAYCYYPLRHLEIISKYADEYSLDISLVCGVIHTESRFNKNAVSAKGAIGLMQIMESTAYWLASQMDLGSFSIENIYEADLNVRMGCYYLSALIKQYGSDSLALCAYNAGSGNVNRWLASEDYSHDGISLYYIPYAETRNYVQRVYRAQKIYGFLIGIYQGLW